MVTSKKRLKYSRKTYSSTILSTTHLTLAALALNLGLYSEQPVSRHLRYNIVFLNTSYITINLNLLNEFYKGLNNCLKYANLFGRVWVNCRLHQNK